jgi:hypothetical protein
VLFAIKINAPNPMRNAMSCLTTVRKKVSVEDSVPSDTEKKSKNPVTLSAITKLKKNVSIDRFFITD